ncbi:phenylacetate--CoA ligase family protein [Bacillus halotolerans]|uniref:phenylacetate--CoA ligase family protein n=1 Tax=Bacillus halotolerans TaxID=260554 RepID=UPI002DB99E00|nr:phenylacetate--CoA ligase family protein [Bacillus halotolerans]MEC1646344.1 phenylacetate--CoA ligase family protein [Bacillus halotolerans]
MNTLSINDKWSRRINNFLDGTVTLDEVHTQNQNSLTHILDYVSTKSPYYSSHLKNVQISKSIEQLSLKSIPFTTKDELRKVGMDICSLGMNEIGTYYETTGTTGIPTPCPRAPIDISTSGLFVHKAMADIYQETFGSTQALTAIMGPSELYAFGDTYAEICRDLGIPYVKLWPESPRVGIEKASELITNLKVKALICSPAIALSLARLYAGKGIDPRKSTVKQIFVLGELCTPEMLRNISEIWDAACTHGLYGSQEIHALATGCIEGNLHISETNYIVEIVPLEGLQKDVGELCITMLVPGAKPLIRFRTGDLASINEATSCKCGSCSRVLKIFGRVDDIVTISGEKYLPAEIESRILNSLNKVEGYKFDITKLDSGEDSVVLSVTTQQTNIDVSVIEKKLTELFKAKVDLRIQDSLDAQTETGAYVSWKFARIRDWR